MRGPFATYDEAKAYARTMSSDPDEALVVEVQPAVKVGYTEMASS